MLCRYTPLATKNPCWEQNLLFTNVYGDKLVSASVTQGHKNSRP